MCISIKPLTAAALPCALDVIHRSFATVAEEFGLTRENCPKHTSFIGIDALTEQFNAARPMFALFESERMVGYYSLACFENCVYELKNLAVLPEYRHNGYGKLLLEHAAKKVIECGGSKIIIGIIEEHNVLKDWYASNGFVHMGTKKFSHLPFTVGFMELTLTK